MSPDMRQMFEMYSRPKFKHLGVSDYRAAFKRLRDDPNLFLFANTKMARHFMNSEPLEGFKPYVYNEGFRSTTHIVFGKGNPFKKIFDIGKGTCFICYL